MVCPECGQVNDDSSSVCVRCDTALTPAVQRGYQQPATVYHPQPQPSGYHPQPAGPSRLPLIAGLSVLVLIALVTGLVVFRKKAPDDNQTAVQPPAVVVTTTEPEPEPDPTTEEPTTGDPQQQAAAIDVVLSNSVTSRAKLNSAIKRVTECRDLSDAVADMQAVGQERQSQIDAVTAADLSALPNGEALRSGLTSALGYALQADQGYLRWAEPTLSAGCAKTGDRTSAYKAGDAASTQAGAAKRTFLTVWNPVAAANGLQTRSALDI